MVSSPKKAPAFRIILVSGSMDDSVHDVVRQIRRLRPKYGLVPIVTTRPAADDDPPGLYRCDVSPGEFAQREANNQFIWSETRDRARYGLTTYALREAYNDPQPAITIVDPEQAQAFKRHFGPDQLKSFFLLPPPQDELVGLLSRTAATETDLERAVQRCRRKSNKASYCGIPYNFINYSAKPEDMARQALEQLR